MKQAVLILEEPTKMNEKCWIPLERKLMVSNYSIHTIHSGTREGKQIRPIVDQSFFGQCFLSMY